MSFALADLAGALTAAQLIGKLISPNQQNQPPPLSGQGGLGGQGSTGGWPTPVQQQPLPAVPGTQDQPAPAVVPGAVDQVVASNAPTVPTPRGLNAITPAGVNVPVPTPQGGTPAWMTMNAGQLYSTNFGPTESIIQGPESGGQNRRQLVKNPQTGVMEPTGPASGYLQIEDNTWRAYAPAAGVDLNRWPTAMSAPPQVQQAVAQNMPLNRWSKGTYDAVKAKFPWATGDMTLGQIDRLALRSGPQRYIPAQPDRGPSEWGRMPPGGYALGPGNMPTTQSDFGNIMQKAMLMAPLLSLFTRKPGAVMMASYSSFVEGYQKGQLLQQQQARTQWQDNLKETRARLETEAMEAGDAFTALQNDPDALSQVLGGIANKYGDDPMRAALANGGPDAVHKLLQGRDAYFTDLNKAATQIERLQLDQQKFVLQQETANLENQIRVQELQTRMETDPDKIAKGKADLARLQQELADKRRKQQQQEQFQREWGIGGGGGDGTAPAPDEEAQPDEGAPDQAPDTGGSATPPSGGAQAAPQATTASPPAATRGTPPTAPAPSGGGGAAPSGPPAQYPPGYDPETGTTRPSGAATPKQQTGQAGQGVQVAEAASDLPDPAAAVIAKREEQQGAPAAPTPQTPQRTSQLSGDALAQRIQQNENTETPVYQYARNLLHGGDPPSGLQALNPEAMRLVVGMQTRLQGLASSGLTGQALIDAVRRVDNGAAIALSRVYNNTGPLPGASARGTISPRMQVYGQTIAALATQAAPPDPATGDPGWRQGQYDLLQKFSDKQSYEQRTLARANTMGESAANVLLDLRELQNNGESPTRIQTAIDAFNHTRLIGDSKYTNLINDLQSFTQEDQALRSGTAGVTETERQIETVAPQLFVGTPDQIRGYIQHNIDTAGARIRGDQSWWRQNHGPGTMTGEQAEAMGVINALPYLNTKTGRFENLPKGMTLPDKLQRAQPLDSKGFDPHAYQQGQ